MLSLLAGGIGLGFVAVKWMWPVKWMWAWTTTTSIMLIAAGLGVAGLASRDRLREAAPQTALGKAVNVALRFPVFLMGAGPVLIFV
jgi:hypothetical protein